MADYTAEVGPELQAPSPIEPPKYLELHTIVCPAMPGLAVQVATGIAPEVAEELHLEEAFAEAGKERTRKILLDPHPRRPGVNRFKFQGGNGG
jgi:hypothetical protein